MPTPKDSRLTFLMPLEDEPQDFLVTGFLRFEGETSHEFYCTSGQPGYQYSGGVLIPSKGPFILLDVQGFLVRWRYLHLVGLA